MPSSSPSSLVPPGALGALPDASPTRGCGMLFILGLGLSVVGTLWMLVLAFRTSLWWGFGCLFIPFVQLCYLFSHWKEAAAYTLCPRCAFPPRRPPSGSVLSLLILSRHVVLYDSGKFSSCLSPVPSLPTLAFVPLARSRHFQHSHNPFHVGGIFRSFTSVRLRYDLSFRSPP